MAMTTSTSTFTTPAPPSEFICPITMELMAHPVRVTPGGRCFERWAILEWIYFGNNGKGGSNPLTRQPLHPEDLKNATVLKRSIEEWRNAHGVPTPVHPYDTDNEEDDEEIKEDSNSDHSEEVQALEDALELAVSLRWNVNGKQDTLKNEPFILDHMPSRLLNIRNRVLQSMHGSKRLESREILPIMH